LIETLNKPNAELKNLFSKWFLCKFIDSKEDIANRSISQYLKVEWLLYESRITVKEIYLTRIKGHSTTFEVSSFNYGKLLGTLGIP